MCSAQWCVSFVVLLTLRYSVSHQTLAHLGKKNIYVTIAEMILRFLRRDRCFEEMDQFRSFYRMFVITLQDQIRCGKVAARLK